MTTYAVCHSLNAPTGVPVAAFPDDWTREAVEERADWLNRGENKPEDFGWQPMPRCAPSQCWVIVACSEGAN